jgi:hypothetical protein
MVKTHPSNSIFENAKVGGEAFKGRFGAVTIQDDGALCQWKRCAGSNDQAQAECG